MKTKTEIHVSPTRVSVFENGLQVVNVLREHCRPDRLPGVAVALAKGTATASSPVTVRTFDEHGGEIDPVRVIKPTASKPAKRARK